MVVALSSLRVSSEFDATGYVRGAAQKIDADARMIAADRARNAALAQADAALVKAIPGMQAVSKALLEGYGSGQQFEGIVRRIGNAVDRGMGLDRAGVLLDAAYKKFGMTADAARLAERGFVSIAPAIDTLNSKYAAHNELAARVTAQTEAMAKAQQFQAGLNSQFGIGANDNVAGRAADFQELGTSLDALRSKYSPLFAAQQGYLGSLKELSSIEARTALTESERAAAIARLKTSFAEQVVGMRSAGTATGLAAHQMTNLGYQINDVATMLASGSSPFQVMATQSGQVYQILSSANGGVTGALKSVGTGLVSIVTPARLAFGGIVTIAGAATYALNTYLTSQDKVRLSLAGIGRASGITAGDINSAARSGPGNGMSSSSAREFATTLAATGKIGRDGLEPLVKIGHDFAVTFGTDASDAATKLAGALADPINGADELNKRLGFLDAATQSQIKNLVAQNRTYEAQRLVIDGVKGSIANAAAVTGGWSQIWNGFKVGAGSTLDVIGEKIANGLHLSDSLEQQRDRLKDIVASYDTELGKLFGSSVDRKADEDALARINALLEQRAQKTKDVATAEASLRMRSTVTSVLPEVDALSSLANRAAVTGATAEDPALMKAMGLTQPQADRANAIALQLRKTFKTTFEEISTSSRISLDAVTAFSPAAKAAIAYRQQEEQLRRSTDVSPEEKKRAAQDAYNVSLKQSVTALSEATRERQLSADQAVKTQQVQIDAIGKSVGEQYRLTATLQARQQVEQEAARNRTAVDEAAFARLQKTINKTAELKQLEAQVGLRKDAAFDFSQIGLTDQEQAINSKLRSVYGDSYATNAAAQADAELLRLNANLKVTSDTGRDAFGGLVKDMVAGKSAAEALNTAIGKIEDKLISMTTDNIWSTAFGGTGGSGFNWSSLFGKSGAGAGGTMSYGGDMGAGTGGMAFPTFHTGGIVGSEGGSRYMHTAHWNDAPRFHTGIGPGERRAILQDGEGVFTKGQMRALGNLGGSSSGGGVTVIINGAPAGSTATATSRKSGNGGMTVEVMMRMVEDGMASNVANGQSPLNTAMQSRYGLDPTRGMG